MNRLFLLATFILLTSSAAVPGQQPRADEKRQQLASLIKELQAQQAALAANQQTIDARIAAVAEAVRQARLYSSRIR